MRTFLTACLFLVTTTIFAQQPMISLWGTMVSSGTKVIRIPAEGFFDYYYEKSDDPSINGSGFGEWGVNSIEVPLLGTYYVHITPTDDSFRFLFDLDGYSPYLIKEVIQWGDVDWNSDLSNLFDGCEYLTISATDIPDFSNVTNMSGMFRFCPSLTGIPNIDQWDVSNVTDLSFMFFSAENFNGNISNWDVSNVFDFRGMFDGANKFNSDLSNWDISNAYDISGMFKNAKLFNSDLSQWDTSLITNMKSTFQFAENFESDLSSWNVSEVTNMEFMFDGAEKFNSNLGGWDVSNVQSMRAMFKNAKMFNAKLSDWNTSSVTNMRSMFHSTENFNSDLNDWNVSGVYEMSKMFNNAIRFNQNLGNWSLSPYLMLESFFDNSGTSCLNYSLTLKGWAENSNTPDNLILGAANMEYGNYAQTYRDMLIIKGWGFFGDIYNQDCTMETNDFILQNQFSIYPNPASDVINLIIPENFNFKKAELFDLSGKLIRTLSTRQIMINDLPNGVYILRVYDDRNRVKAIKLIKK